MKTDSIHYTINQKLRILLCIAICVVCSSCEDFILVDPPEGQLIKITVFTDDLTAKSAMAGLYGKIALGGGPFSGGSNGISLTASLSSDELRITGSTEELIQFYENALLSTNTRITTMWNSPYEYIYVCNSLIEGLDQSTGLTPSLKNQLKGEATFIRAFVHFYLVNLFGKVPYVTTTNYEVNAKIGRMEISEVYEKLIEDLVVARDLMSPEYPNENGSRTRANSFAASTLLARVYLFNGNYAEAEAEATRVIESPLYKIEDIDNVFTVYSQEAIWQLSSNDYEPYTNDGGIFLGTDPKTLFLTNELINSFEIQDLRLQHWMLEADDNGMPSYVPYKYKDSYTATTLNELSTLLRLAEVHLVRAEARLRLDRWLGENSAATDLDAVRERAGLDSVPAMTKDQTLYAISLERQHELFTEWGARWIDLKRLNKATEVLSPIKIDWESTDVLYPLPYDETLVNINLPQNDGYN